MRTFNLKAGYPIEMKKKQINYLAVRPERVEGRAVDCDTLSSGERGKVRGFGILNLVHWTYLVFGPPARSPALRDERRCLGFGAYYTLWMISSNSFLSGRLDNDFRMIR